CHVVRCFEDENITHVSGKINPIDDIETINLELILADLDTVNRRYDRVEKLARQRDKEAVEEYEVMKKLKDSLEEEIPVRSISFTDEQKKLVKQLHLLTEKPVLYVANVSEDEIAEAHENEYVKQVQEYSKNEDADVVII